MSALHTPLPCPGPTAEEMVAWLQKLRVPPGAKKGAYRYLKTSHIETAKSTERADIYYTFHEVLYALCERRAGRSMPRNSEELDTLRVRDATVPAPAHCLLLCLAADRSALSRAVSHLTRFVLRVM